MDGSTITLSNTLIMMLARTGPSDEPIETPSFCLRIVPLNGNAVFVQQSLLASLNVFFCNFVLTRFSL